MRYVVISKPPEDSRVLFEGSTLREAVEFVQAHGRACNISEYQDHETRRWTYADGPVLKSIGL